MRRRKQEEIHRTDDFTIDELMHMKTGEQPLVQHLATLVSQGMIERGEIIPGKHICTGFYAWPFGGEGSGLSAEENDNQVGDYGVFVTVSYVEVTGE